MAEGKSLKGALAAVTERALRSMRYRLGALSSGSMEDEVLPAQMESYGLPDRHVFFGYYDVTPFDASNELLLAHVVANEQRPPHADEAAEVGFFHRGETDFHGIGRTGAWCRQQGARLQWYPRSACGRTRQVFYNAGGDRKFHSLVQDVYSRSIIARFDRPLYDLSPDGNFGLGLDFVRLGRLRPGYGYASTAAVDLPPAPTDDGIYALFPASNSSHLLFSVADVASIDPHETMAGALHYLNHISIAPDGKRFVFFHFWVNQGRKRSRIMVCDDMNASPRSVMITSVASHYAWVDSSKLLCFCAREGEELRYRILELDTGRREVIDHPGMRQDGHPTTIRAGRAVLTDTYPDRQAKQNLLFCDLDEGSLTTLARLHNPAKFKGEVRCDLHPRLSPDEKWVCVDSARSGRAALYVFPLLAGIAP